MHPAPSGPVGPDTTPTTIPPVGALRGSATAANQATQTARVLLAEDNATIRAGLRELLARAPEFELVGEAKDGREAVELAASLHPDVVLLDLRMPDVDGAAAAAQISAFQPAPKIIIVTTDDSARAESVARSAGAAAIVTKDECVTALIPALRRVLSDKEAAP